MRDSSSAVRAELPRQRYLHSAFRTMTVHSGAAPRRRKQSLRALYAGDDLAFELVRTSPVNRPGSSAARNSSPPKTRLNVIVITSHNAGLTTSDSLFPHIPSLCSVSSLPHSSAGLFRLSLPTSGLDRFPCCESVPYCSDRMTPDLLA